MGIRRISVTKEQLETIAQKCAKGELLETAVAEVLRIEMKPGVPFILVEVAK